MCHRSVGLIQRGFEAAGIPTVSVTHLPRVTAKVGVPRALQIPWPMGQAFGPAGESETHRKVVRQALDLLGQAEAPTLASYA